MGAIVPDSAKPEAVFNPAPSTRGPRLASMKIRRLPFITQAISTGDTYTAPGGAVSFAAWEPVNSSDDMAAVVASNVITFTGTTGSDGYLWLFSSE